MGHAVSVLVSGAKGFPELLIWHDHFMLGTPMSIYAVPPISLKSMATDRALPWPLRSYSFLAAEAFRILFHVFSPGSVLVITSPWPRLLG